VPYACGFRIDGDGVLRSHSGGTRCTGFSDFPASTLRHLRLPAQYGRHPRGSRAPCVYRAGGAAGAACAEAESEICRKSPSCPARIDCRSHDPWQRPLLSDNPGRSGDATRERRHRNRTYAFRWEPQSGTSGRFPGHWVRAQRYAGSSPLLSYVACS
jgi:hypothetical protein